MINIKDLNLKLLYVEDDNALRTAFTRIISSMGFKVYPFKNAESAWGNYLKDEYAIVLTDWELPGISGFELCRKIHKTHPNKSILIIITGHDDQEKLNMIIKEVIDDYIVKGSSSRDLRIRLTIAARVFIERMIIKKYKTKIQDIHTNSSQIFNSVGDGIVVVDKNNNITQVNKAFEVKLNIKKPILGNKIKNLFNELFYIKKTTNTNEDILNYIENIGRECIERKVEIISKDNREFVFIISISSLMDKNNICHGTIYTFKDITERRLIENRYRSLFEESKDMIITTSLEGDILEINSSGIELLGFSSLSELKNKKIFDFYYNVEDKDYFNRQIKEKGYIKDIEIILKKNDGKIIFVLQSTTPVRNNLGKIIEYKSIIKDISNRIKSEQNLMQLNCELAEINEKLKHAQTQLVQQEKLASIGLLSAGIAHEINNPLGFIKSNFSSMKNYFKSIFEYINKLEETAITNSRSNENIRNDMEKLKNDIRINFILDDIDSLFKESDEGFKRIISIIKNLKKFARQDLVKKFELCDLNSLIETTLSIAWNEIKYDAEVKKELNEIPKIKFLRNEISQVLLNLIVNAAQAIKSQNKKGMGLIVIKTNFDKENDKVVFEISDNGPGIPLKLIGKIFDPFFTTKDVGKGTGLGLSISHDIIVNKHNGEIGVKTDPGKGTTFIIKLPIIQPVED